MTRLHAQLLRPSSFPYCSSAPIMARLGLNQVAMMRTRTPRTPDEDTTSETRHRKNQELRAFIAYAYKLYSEEIEDKQREEFGEPPGGN